MNPGNGDAERVAAMVIRNQETLLRVARQVSLCADDAHDAVQRALEIYLRRLDTVDERTELAWLKVVVRNEALTVRKSRSMHLTAEDIDLDAHPASTRDPHEQALGAERVARSAEALRALKHDEARALLAKSMGMSYDEIGRRFNWTYTKTNRAITEGRARFRRRYDDIEGGRECERLAPALAALAAEGTAGERAAELRAHVRGCGSCRATVRGARGGMRTRAVAAMALPVKWLADRLGQAKVEAYAWSARAGEIAATVPAGGGRATAATALVGVCLGGVGAGGYCVTKELLDTPRERRSVVRVAAAAPERRIPERPPARVRVEHPVRAKAPAPRPAPRPRSHRERPATAAPEPTPPREEFEVAAAAPATPASTEFGAPAAGSASEFSSVE